LLNQQNPIFGALSWWGLHTIKLTYSNRMAGRLC